MGHTIKNSKACVLSLIFMFCILESFTSCNATPQADFTTIKTDIFSLAVPSDWNTVTKPEVVFKTNGNVIGGVSEMNYDPSQPISQLYGNQAEEISQTKRSDLSLPATEVVLRRSSPAAESEQTSVDELHYYLIPQNGKIAYDLNFDSNKVDKSTAEKIAKSFTIN